ncbi:MAG: hypothetical protein NZM42_06405 [Gemmatales bacterium]|nr:hypothetical protein [Gemmatales bacterium]
MAGHLTLEASIRFYDTDRAPAHAAKEFRRQGPIPGTICPDLMRNHPRWRYFYSASQRIAYRADDSAIIDRNPHD